jgi:hypothetical protein
MITRHYLISCRLSIVAGAIPCLNTVKPGYYGTGNQRILFRYNEESDIDRYYQAGQMILGILLLWGRHIETMKSNTVKSILSVPKLIQSSLF